MLKKFLCAALLCWAPLQAFASPEQDAMKALDDANAQVRALSVFKSPSVSSIDSAKGELNALVPFFERVKATLAGLNVTSSTQLLSLGADVEAKVSTAGKLTTIDIGVFADLCRGIQGDLDQWQSLQGVVYSALQQHVDAAGIAQLNQATGAKIPTPIPGLAAGANNTPTPVPAYTPSYPTAVPTLPPIVQAAPTPTPIGAIGGGDVIPGGWTPPPPTAFVTAVPGAPTPIHTPIAQLRAPLPIVTGHNGQRVWVANVRANTVAVMDAHAQRFVAEIPVGTQPQALGLDDGDNTLVVANFASNNVSLVDGRTDKVLKTLNVGAGPLQVLVTHSGKAYVLCQDGKSLAVIDLNLKLVTKSIHFNSRPGRMDQPNSSQDIYVSLPDEDSVAVVDTGYDDVVATITE